MWGDKPPQLIEMLMQSDDVAGIQRYLDRPTLQDHLGFYWGVFWDLANHEGIPFADLDRYAARYGIEDVDEFDRFATVVRRLNSEWLKLVRKAADKPVSEDDDEEPPKPKPRAKVI